MAALFIKGAFVAALMKSAFVTAMSSTRRLV